MLGLMMILKAAMPKAGTLYLINEAGEVVFRFTLAGDNLVIFDSNDKEFMTVVKMPFLK